MKVKFLRYNENAVLPKKAYKSDFCYDLTAISEEEIAPDVWKYGFGFGLQIERSEFIHSLGRMMLHDVMTGEERKYIFCQSTDMESNEANLSIDIRPRSSIWKTGMVLSNSVGTVDEGYTNEISAVFYHVNKNLPRYKVGDRIAQMKIGLTHPVSFVEVEELNETDRNLNGYGSTGR